MVGTPLGSSDTMSCDEKGIMLDKEKESKDVGDGNGKSISTELWYACAGPMVNLPRVGSLAYYFPQGHSEQVTVFPFSFFRCKNAATQVAISTQRTATSQIPNYPNLAPQLLCQVHGVTLHADKDTDDIYAQMSLRPLASEIDVFSVSEVGLKPHKHPVEFFCKTLTASDTSTHGGFSVPRRAAEKLFPPLDYSMEPPTQELVVKDLHNNTWAFRHIYRGQPKRHLLTTGWSSFVGSKRLRAADSVLFIRDDESQLMIGVRRANRPQTTLPSSVLSADSMHIGVLAAAAHAVANRTSFTVFYNPRACPSEFVIPLVKYRKAVYGTRLSVGMRFGMMFEAEESGKRRYMGTIVGMNDLDPMRWPGSKWRNVMVEWDEPGCSDKHSRVSPWEIETPESIFIFPSLSSGFKRPLHSAWGNVMKRPQTWTDRDAMVSEFQQVLTQASCSSISQEMNTVSLDHPKSLRYPTLVEATPRDMLDASFPMQRENNSFNSIVPEPTNPMQIHNAVDTLLEGSSVYQWMPRPAPYIDPIRVQKELDPASIAKNCCHESCDYNVVDIRSDCFIGDVQSQITAATLPESHPLSLQDKPDSSGDTCCSNAGFDKSNLYYQKPPRVRTYTKVQKAGCVGRSIDVSSFKNYEQLCGAIESMFGLQGLLNDPRGPGWKLVYVDYENDVLLIGDDPWEEFVGCVRCIRILSPSEVQEMSDEGMKILSMQGMTT